MAAALEQAVKRKVPVVPIFLKDVPRGVGPESLPTFLRSRVAVDLREESFDRLVQGLRVVTELARKLYHSGIKASPEYLKQETVIRDEVLPQLNYTFEPQ